MHFDTFIMVDWSAASSPKTGKDSIWIAEHSPAANRRGFRRTTLNPATRQTALAHLVRVLNHHAREHRRTLLGFDFSLGYPHRFASSIGCGNWLELLEFFRTQITDLSTNANNRYPFAVSINEMLGVGPGPFWGCHASASSSRLTSRRLGHFDFPYQGLAEFRETELHAKQLGFKPQSVWKLGGIGAVGSQTILGLKVVAELRLNQQLGLTDFVRGWPFETGAFETGTQPPVTVVEIFPSSLPIKPADQEKVQSGRLVLDQLQVLNCVRRMANLQSRGQLAAKFDCPKLGLEEGWIVLV